MATQSYGKDPISPIGGRAPYNPNINYAGSGIGTKAASATPSAAAAQAARLSAQAAAQKKNSGGAAGALAGGIGKGLGKGAGADAGVDLMSLLNSLMGGGGSGGGGGGGGGGAAIAGMLADVDNREAKARDRYAKNAADTSTMYGQLASAISGFKPQIEQGYDTQLANNTQRATENQGALSSELATQDTRRQAGAADLGITGAQLAGGPELQSNVVLNEAMGNIGETAQNWQGFLGSERENAIGRNQNTADAATGTGAQTTDQLRMALESYLQGLDSERAQIKAQGASGGGGRSGGGPSGGGALQTYLGKALIDQMFQGDEPSEYEEKLNFYKSMGITPKGAGNSLYQIGLGDRGQATANDYWTKFVLGLGD